MGNSRKYPYYTMDGFYILTPPPLPMDFLNASSPHALKIPGSLTFFRLDICLFKSVFKEYTCVCPRWKFQIYLPHHALGVPIVSIPLPPPFPACLCIPCLVLWIPLSHPWYGKYFFLEIHPVGNKNMQLVLQHGYKTSWIAVLHVLPPTNQPVLQQIRLMQVAKSCCTKSLHVVHFTDPRQTCFAASPWGNSRVRHDSSVILSNQKSVFRQLARQVWTWSDETCSIAFRLVWQQCCKTSWTFLFCILL